MDENADGKYRFILVQLPEPILDSDFANVAEVAKERVRRASKKINLENQNYSGDLGFKVFKLDSSNIRSWEPNRDDLASSLFDSTEHIKSGRTEDDILYELLIKLGLDLAVPIETKTIEGMQVHSIGAGALIACLPTSITREQVEPLAMGIIAWHREEAPSGEVTVVFRDSAFADDVAKTNMAAILSQHGLTTVRSL
jgi:adenine-specific DNA-methyltransferase